MNDKSHDLQGVISERHPGNRVGGNSGMQGRLPRDITYVSMSEVLLARLPLEIWTECDDGQALLQLVREGRCRYTRLNSTLGHFERIP